MTEQPLASALKLYGRWPDKRSATRVLTATFGWPSSSTLSVLKIRWFYTSALS
ncbi:hypothetical protein KCP76_05635 [Salmonella enterica subsp. enterica serovar Weltevreden]|nr:hypothetical protein KCP76_05635 [Salmonella enterica subsp. enterica serovar Weltevreden]